MSQGIVFHLLAAMLYTLLAASRWRALAQATTPLIATKPAQAVLAIAILLHGVALWQVVLPEDGLRLGWSLALSVAIWLGMVVFWFEQLASQVESLQLILLPAAAIAAALGGLFPAHHFVDHAGNEWLRVHLAIALTAYGIITIAALQAMLMTALDRQLHRPIEPEATRSLLGRALDTMPALLVQEVLLFRLIWIGFGILTLTVVTGAIASTRISGQLFPLDHKTVFTFLSWLTFGGLLLGRYLRGWRGRIALRWTLVGFGFLVLAYSGSRFVIDVILQRS